MYILKCSKLLKLLIFVVNCCRRYMWKDNAHENFREQNLCEQWVNHDIHENIIAQKFGGIWYVWFTTSNWLLQSLLIGGFKTGCSLLVLYIWAHSNILLHCFAMGDVYDHITVQLLESEKCSMDRVIHAAFGENVDKGAPSLF